MAHNKQARRAHFASAFSGEIFPMFFSMFFSEKSCIRPRVVLTCLSDCECPMEMGCDMR